MYAATRARPSSVRMMDCWRSFMADDVSQMTVSRYGPGSPDCNIGRCLRRLHPVAWSPSSGGSDAGWLDCGEGWEVHHRVPGRAGAGAGTGAGGGEGAGGGAEPRGI